MIIDELGFITPIETNKFNSINFLANNQIYYKMEDKPNKSNDIYSYNFNQTMTKINNVKKIRSKNNCWICEGWREHHFSVKRDLHKFISDEDENVVLHLSFENYKPNEVLKNEITRDFDTYRMCPPEETTFYYSLNNEIALNNRRNASLPSFDVIKTMMDNQEDKNDYSTLNSTKFNSSGLFGKNSGQIVNIPSKAICRYYHEFNKNVINVDYFTQLMYCKPRPRKDTEIIIRPKTPWSFPVSIWATHYDYNYEDETEVNIAML